MKTTKMLVLLLAGSTALQAGECDIFSLTTNGRLTFTNAFTNGLFTVQWAPSLPANWSESWANLRDFAVTGKTTSVEVPMFYRVKCVTNLLMPLSIGSWSTMSVSNALGNVWAQRATVVGTVFLPSKGKDFTVLEYMNPIDPPNAPLIAVRSTEAALYSLDKNCGAESLGLTNAPVGTSWTNTTCGHTDVATIETNETVAVPAGTFSCLKVHKERLDASHPNPVHVEWWAPGFGLIKWIDYFVDADEHPPIVYQLTGYGSNPR
jgi:hypothetical protein